MAYREFIEIMTYFAEGRTVKASARQGNLAGNTFSNISNKIDKQVADDITNLMRIGRLDTVGQLRTLKNQSKSSVNSAGRIWWSYEPD